MQSYFEFDFKAGTSQSCQTRKRDWGKRELSLACEQFQSMVVVTAATNKGIGIGIAFSPVPLIDRFLNLDIHTLRLWETLSQNEIRSEKSISLDIASNFQAHQSPWLLFTVISVG